jgi:predicted glycosyltransferase
VQKRNSEVKISIHSGSFITVSERSLPIIPAITGRSILTSIKASKRETEIAIAVSIKKNRLIFFLSDPNIFFTETSFALWNDKAVLMFTKLKQAINNINKPIPENMYSLVMLPFSPISLPLFVVE